MFYKPEFRKKIIAKRQQLDPTSIEQAANQVTAQVIHLPQFIESQTIALYLPKENELDTAPIIQCALDLGKKLFLPLMSQNGNKVLSFYSYHPEDTLVKNRFDILEPDPKLQTPINLVDLDITFTPLVGFDKDCNRLGRGVGHYDYTFAPIKDTKDQRPLLIGLGYEFQKIPAIEPSKWDVPMDFVITEEATYLKSAMPG